MSQRQDKKLRRLYRKDLGQRAEQQSKEVERLIAEQVEELKDLLKPNPKLIPAFIWVSLQRLFLNI